MRWKIRLKLHLSSFMLLPALLLGACGQAPATPPQLPSATLTPQPTLKPTRTPTITLEPTATIPPISAFLAAALPEHAAARLNEGPVRNAAVSPTGEDFAVATSIGVYAYHLDPGTGTLAETWFAPTSVEMAALEFSQDGRILAGATTPYSTGDSPCDAYAVNLDVEILLWDAASGEVLQGFTGNSSQRLQAFAGDASLIGLGSEYGSISLVDSQTGAKIHLPTEPDDHISRVQDLAFSTDKRYVAAGVTAVPAGATRMTGFVLVWDVAQRKLVTRLRLDSTTSINQVAFSPDGAWLAGADPDGNVSLWTTADWLPRQLLIHSRSVTQLAFSPDGASLVTADERGVIYVWQPSSGKLLRNIAGAAAGLEALRFSADGTILFAYGRNDVAYRWNFASGGLLQSAYLTGHNDFWSMAYSASANLIAAGTLQGDIMLYDLTTRQPVTTYAHVGKVTSLAFASDGRTLISAGADRQVILWGVTGELRLQKLRSYSGLADVADAVAYSPDRSIVAAGTSEEIALWQAGDGTLIRTFDGFPGLAFSPDGATLAYLTADKIVLAGVNSGRPILSLGFYELRGLGSARGF